MYDSQQKEGGTFCLAAFLQGVGAIINNSLPDNRIKLPCKKLSLTKNFLYDFKNTTKEENPFFNI
jgi:hypothetical protein